MIYKANKRILDLFNKWDESKKNSEPTIDNKILICDGTNTFMRCISVNTTISENGIHVGGLTGFLSSLGFSIRNICPTKVIIVFDGEGGSLKRKKIFPEYKSNRIQRKTPVSSLFNSKEEELRAISFEMKRLALYLKSLPVKVIVANNTEADDIIAYICTEEFLNDRKVIMSTDKDFFQLINDKISVWNPTQKKLYTPEIILDEFNISSKNFIIFKVLTGDSSDNIHGIKGIGLKSILKNFEELKEDNEITMEKIIEISFQKNKLAKIYKKISDNIDKLKLNFQLLQLSKSNLSDHSKTIISNHLKSPINELNKFMLQKLIIEDGINSEIKNFESWVKKTWWTLNAFSRNSNQCH